MEDDYSKIGRPMAWMVAAPTFLGCWLYAIAAYGLFLGVGLGWFPSLIITVMAYWITRALWPLLLLAVAAIIVFFVVTAR